MYGDVVELADHDAGVAIIAPEIDLRTEAVGACAVAVRFNEAGTLCALASGDGAIRIAAPREIGAGKLTVTTRIDGVPLGLAGDTQSDGFLVCGEDGVLRRIAPTGETEPLVGFPKRWVENLVRHPETGRLAVSVGRAVHVLTSDGARLGVFDDHPSTPAGLCFSPDGNRIAVARYNGVSVWTLGDTPQPPTDLAWRGSHTGVTWSPDGEYIVTSTQEREMHCWSLADGGDMRMSGYPGKIRSMSWTADSAFLSASGADTVTSWSFTDGGPQGKPPLELGYVFNGTVTNVAAHPLRRTVAGGYNDGTVLIGDIVKGDALIAKPAGGGAVTCQAWAPDGRCLVAGTEDGLFAVMKLTG